jgi:hypothetical protein
MRKAIIATSVAAVALGAMVSQASANVSATCVKPGTITSVILILRSITKYLCGLT